MKSRFTKLAPLMHVTGPRLLAAIRFSRTLQRVTTLGLLIALGLTTAPAVAVSLYVTPDIPTDLGGTTFLPSHIVRYNTPAYALALALPAGTSIDGLHRMNGGDWLFSVEAPTDLGPATFQPRDVIRFNGVGFGAFFCGSLAGIPVNSDIDAVFLVGGDLGDLVLSFDIPTSIGPITVDPSDLVRFQHTGATCGSWAAVGLFFDASSAAPPVPISSNVTAADVRDVRTIMSFDIPTSLGVPTFLPGNLESWNGAAFALFEPLAGWPISSFVNAISFLPDPGLVPTTMLATRLVQDGSLINLRWDPSCSVGAEDYGIYEGALGTWYSHTRIDCSDGLHDLNEDIGTTSGSRYYLVVAENGNDEGSYGTSSSLVERPVGTSMCVPTQVLSPCP